MTPIFRPPKTNGKHNWRWQFHNQTERSTQPIASRHTWIYLSSEHFSLFHRISGQCSDSHCSSQSHPPTKFFFRCLAVTDLCVGLIVQPLFTAIILSRITDVSENVVYPVSFYLALSLILSGVSGLTTTAISVDRLLAVLLGLRYRHVVTLRRVRVVIICLWFIGVTLGFGVIMSIDITLKAASVLVLFCLIISIFCYSKIFYKLRHQQAQV